MTGQDGGGQLRSPFGDTPVGPALAGDLYTTATRIVRSGARPRPSWTPLIILAVLLALPVDGKVSASSIAIVAGAILLRDVLRFAALHILDCPADDLVMLPFLRRTQALESGPRQAWREALVVLSGPLLSILLVLVLAIQVPAGGSFDRRALTAVLGLNAFMLLPFGNFDGSRVLNLVIFARSRISEVLFLFVTALALAGLGFLMRSWIMGVFGVLGVWGAYRRLGFRRVVSEIRDFGPPLSSPVETLDDVQMYRLFHAARTLVGAGRPGANQGIQLAGTYAMTMRRIHADATIVFPSLPLTVLILFLYGASFVLAVITFFFVPH